jgi:hypothetical protein
MAKRITVVISQGQSANPQKRKLEEDLVSALLFEPGVEVTVIPHLYDLAPDGTGMLCLQGIMGDMIVASWLYPRGAHWVLDRNQIRGHFGASLLKSEEADDDEDEESEETSAEIDDSRVLASREIPNRKIYHLDLRSAATVEPFVAEVRRIVKEASVQTVDLLGFLGGSPKPEQVERYLTPAPGNVASSELAGGNGVSRAPLVPGDRLQPLHQLHGVPRFLLVWRLRRRQDRDDPRRAA